MKNTVIHDLICNCSHFQGNCTSILFHSTLSATRCKRTKPSIIQNMNMSWSCDVKKYIIMSLFFCFTDMCQSGGNVSEVQSVFIAGCWWWCSRDWTWDFSSYGAACPTSILCYWTITQLLWKKKGLLLIGYMVDLLSICLNQFVMNLGFINNISLT